MARTVTYKRHQIKARAVLVTDSEEGDWAADAVVPPPGGHREQPLPDPDDRTFPTQEDAEGHAVHLAMRWVDRHGA